MKDERAVLIRLPDSVHRDSMARCRDMRISLNTAIIGLLTQWSDGRIVFQDSFLPGIQAQRRGKAPRKEE